jgi:carbonic anhydrase
MGADVGLSAEDALQRLQDGNRRFLVDEPAANDTSRQRRLDIAKGQRPFATLVGCSDSRVGPELLFGVGLGDLFIIRTAGNNVDIAGLGSIEYSVAVLNVRLVVVLGHDQCGAVMAAESVVNDDVELPGSIGRMIEPIIPAVLRAQRNILPGESVLDRAAKENVRQIVRRLRTASEPILLDGQHAGTLKVVGAMYRLETGKVEFFDT